MEFLFPTDSSWGITGPKLWLKDTQSNNRVEAKQLSEGLLSAWMGDRWEAP